MPEEASPAPGPPESQGGNPNGTCIPLSISCGGCWTLHKFPTELVDRDNQPPQPHHRTGPGPWGHRHQEPCPCVQPWECSLAGATRQSRPRGWGRSGFTDPLIARSTSLRLARPPRRPCHQVPGQGQACFSGAIARVHSSSPGHSSWGSLAGPGRAGQAPWCPAAVGEDGVGTHPRCGCGQAAGASSSLLATRASLQALEGRLAQGKAKNPHRTCSMSVPPSPPRCPGVAFPRPCQQKKKVRSGKTPARLAKHVSLAAARCRHALQNAVLPFLQDLWDF